MLYQIYRHSLNVNCFLYFLHELLIIVLYYLQPGAYPGFMQHEKKNNSGVFLRLLDGMQGWHRTFSTYYLNALTIRSSNWKMVGN